MATYVYECPQHGRFDVVKPMSSSGQPELCSAPVDPVEDTGYDSQCGWLMTKIITPPAAIHANGSSGDGYLFNSKSGLRSKGRRSREV